MYHWCTQRLADLRVGRKLAFGFGLVLLLTLAVMFTGIRGIDRMIDSSDQMVTVSELENAIKDARAQRLQFVSTGDLQHARNIEQLIDAMLAISDRLEADAHTAQGRTRLEQLRSEINAYRQSLAALIRAQEDRNAARAVLIKSAEAVLAQFAELQKRRFDDLARDPTNPALLDETRTITGLNQQLLSIRYLVRGFVFQQTPESEQPAQAALAQLQRDLDALRQQATGDFADYLARARPSFDAYLSAVRQFGQGVEASRAAIDTMGKHAETMRDQGNRIYELQVKARSSDATSARSQLLVTTLLAISLAVFAAWSISRQILDPLRQALAFASRIADGDLRAELQANRQDELGQLQRALQAMAGNLRQLIGRIGDGVTQIASAAEELSAVTEQTSAGVNAQKVETDQVATAMNEMAATVHDVARNAEQASEAAASADREAAQGDRLVRQALGQVDRLAAEVGRSTESVQQLRRESDKIGSVLDVIKTVADQTNLLALNAAIEAARAGEAGRGFAVVADEVRGLAQRTQQSTEEIQELIAGLQNGSQQAAGMMESSLELTEDTLRLAREAGDSLTSITGAVSAIQSMNQQIAAAAEQQSAVAEEINRSVFNVRDISEQTAAASDQTAASSVELARLGNELQQMVGRFRV